ncbi:MAG: hypothetical protein ACR2N2_05345 [Acidimicrobiia bacterium]
MSQVSPGASFEFIAHLAGWGLQFPINGNGWGGALPTAVPAEGATVWGAVLTVPDFEAESLNAVEAAEGRDLRSVEVIDRTGKRHSVMTHLADAAGASGVEPSAEYVNVMLSGSRHWSLPAGWIVGLEDHIGSDF